jgi:hypothetical protein
MLPVVVQAAVSRPAAAIARAVRVSVLFICLSSIFSAPVGIGNAALSWEFRSGTGAFAVWH